MGGSRKNFDEVVDFLSSQRCHWVVGMWALLGVDRLGQCWASSLSEMSMYIVEQLASKSAKFALWKGHPPNMWELETFDDVWHQVPVELGQHGKWSERHGTGMQQQFCPMSLRPLPMLSQFGWRFNLKALEIAVAGFVKQNSWRTQWMQCCVYRGRLFGAKTMENRSKIPCLFQSVAHSGFQVNHEPNMFELEAFDSVWQLTISLHNCSHRELKRF